MKLQKTTRKSEKLTLAQRSTRAWNVGAIRAFRRGHEHYAAWLGKYGKLAFVAEWPEELLSAIEERYGLR